MTSSMIQATQGNFGYDHFLGYIYLSFLTELHNGDRVTQLSATTRMI
jgi:hypothetical protein